MAGNLLENILGLYLGYQGQRTQAYGATRAAQEAAGRRESDMADYVSELEGKYASQLRGDVLPSETAYKQSQLGQLDTELNEQQIQAEAAIRNKLAAAGISQGSALPTSLGQLGAAKIKGMAKGSTDLDAAIQGQINQRMLAAQQIIEGARGREREVVQNAAAEYDAAQRNLETSGTQFLNQNLQQILSTLVQGGKFGADYTQSLAEGREKKVGGLTGRQRPIESISDAWKTASEKAFIRDNPATIEKLGAGDVLYKAQKQKDGSTKYEAVMKVPGKATFTKEDLLREKKDLVGAMSSVGSNKKLKQQIANLFVDNLKLAVDQGVMSEKEAEIERKKFAVDNGLE